MKTLHILRSEPTPMTHRLIQATCAEGDDSPFVFYQEDIEYTRLIEKIFSCDRVICWW